MTTTHTEREAKFAVDHEFTIPDLPEFERDHRIARDTINLVSVYYDTDELDLAARRITLRRRTGDDDEGWQLKVPVNGNRDEITEPVGEADGLVPISLVSLLDGVSLRKPLAPVTTIATERHRRRFLDDDGNMVFEIADDQVTATSPDDSTIVDRWREIEVELGTANDEVLSAITKRFTKAGASPSEYPSKPAHALKPKPALADHPQHRKKAGRAAERYIGAQIEKILAGDIGLRRGTDPIHDTRVAIRRLRSTVRVFGDALKSETADSTAAELRWFAGLLGEVRDRQVQRKRFAKAAKEIGPNGGVKVVHLDSVLEDEQRVCRERVTAAMDSVRYRSLLAALVAWSGNSPVADDVRRKKLLKDSRKAARKADRRLAAGIESGNDTDLHRARKAAKRARYAAELLEPIVGRKKSKKQVKHYKKIQRTLGDHQDGVVGATTLWRLGTEKASELGPDGFTCGLLYKQEMDAAARGREDARRLRS